MRIPPAYKSDVKVQQWILLFFFKQSRYCYLDVDFHLKIVTS